MQSEYIFLCKLITNYVYFYFWKYCRIYFRKKKNEHISDSYYSEVTHVRNDHNNIFVIVMSWIIHGNLL